MEAKEIEELVLLRARHQKLFDAVTSVRTAQNAYYAYRPKSEMDIPHKEQLLIISKQKERELDGIIREEKTGIQKLF